MSDTQKLYGLSLFLALLSMPVIVNAYELFTHAQMTQVAISRSVEMNSAQFQFYKNLGIYSIVINHPFSQYTPNPFGRIYYDVSGDEIRTRTNNAFENSIIRSTGVAQSSFRSWLLRGAIREDDWTSINIPGVCSVQAENPQEENIDRPLNHFFDPVRNIPLTVLGFAQGQRAPDWAIGSADAFGQPNDPESGRRNHFTVFDAREAMYRALTGKTKEGADAGPGGVEAKDEHRKAYWATTFRALGDVVHLVQDMGQPQHTRSILASNEGEGSRA